MFGLGAPELLIILFVILLVFGSTKLPKLARSMGQASKEFKQGLGRRGQQRRPRRREGEVATPGPLFGP